MIRIGEITLPFGLMLAPMAGYTDRAMRRVCRLYGAEYTVTEMVSPRLFATVTAKRPLLRVSCRMKAPVPFRSSAPTRPLWPRPHASFPQE